MSGKGYVNPQLLISAEELKSRIDDTDICIVDTRPTHEYVIGRIPNALHLDLYGISLNDTSETPFNAFMWTIAHLFSARGVDSRKTIVWYENISGVRAARGFWFCEYFGHDYVRVLDGGYNAWITAKGRVSFGATLPDEVPPFPINPQADSHIGTADILDQLNQSDFAVLDTRSGDEHYGRIARAARGGAIPGSVHIEWLNNLDKDGAFKPADELQAMYRAAGITPEKRVMCY